MAQYRYADIFEAIWANDIEAVKTFLPRQLEARDWLDRTPLHWTCIKGHTEIVCLLLDYKADIEAKNKFGFTPLHYACDHGRHKESELLVKRGADPYARDNKGRIPLDLDEKTVKDR